MCVCMYVCVCVCVVCVCVHVVCSHADMRAVKVVMNPHFIIFTFHLCTNNHLSTQEK